MYPPSAAAEMMLERSQQPFCVDPEGFKTDLENIVDTAFDTEFSLDKLKVGEGTLLQ